jgi:uncharacterized membrane protein YbhN (UPF0104 family)
VLEGLFSGFSALKSPAACLAAVLLSLLIVALAASTNYVLFLAFGLPLPPLAALLLLVLLQVGSVPPSLPGKIGIFHYLTVVALGLFAVDRERALSYSIVLYAVALLPKLVLGAVYVALGARPGRLATLVQPVTESLAPGSTAARGADRADD